ncbi:uncharacterized protein FTOL_13915 [Fusarium torulosum]|uniref:Uncharacterized protein n=1 Tax=Fusarium torulosum TaxID=33205 RepID=A0AAE8MQA0_9HYPO|nr:uncharacterized protein FTOL_13915 [Fusarium torulosum]
MNFVVKIQTSAFFYKLA